MELVMKVSPSSETTPEYFFRIEYGCEFQKDLYFDETGKSVSNSEINKIESAIDNLGMNECLFIKSK